MSKFIALIDFMQEVDAAINAHTRGPRRMDYTIGGGALRDTLLGRTVKDIDVVVAQEFGWGAAWPGDTDYGPTGGFKATNAAFRVRDLPVQLIYRDGDTSIHSMMQYHSMGVSNVFWRDGALTIDPVFFRDVADQRHTVNRERWGGCGDFCDDRLQKYIDKITAKYPWPLRGE